jgi:glycosyltransferase involved in cell wall biosynthesis
VVKVTQSKLPLKDSPKDPKVSVCLPVFNGSKYLKSAIANISNQSFTDWELVIRDDCSTDSSRQIIDEAAKSDDRIKVVHDSNTRLGLFENYNACIQAASGTYIKLYAQDDLLESECLQRMVEVLEAKPDVALVTCGKRWIDENDLEIEKLVRFKKDVQLKADEVIVANLIVLQNWIGEPSTGMFRRKDAGAGLDGRLYHWGDIDYWFRILQNGDFYYLSDVLCGFRRHRESTTSTNLTGLYFVADLVRIWKSWGHYLERIGEDEAHYFKRAAEQIALHIDHLVVAEGLTVEALRRANPRGQTAFSKEEVADFREALFYAEQRITSLMKELIYTANQLEHREGECKELKAAIAQMETSISWKLTRPLRSVRSQF